MRWTVTSSNHVYRDRWISIRADSCQLPKGTEVDPYYVLEYPDWVNIVAITTQEEVVLIRQYRHGLGKVTLELPCGVMESKDASPLDAARRELLEETGFSAASLRKTGELSANAATHNNRTHCILAPVA